MKFQMSATSTDHSPTRGSARISLALLLVALLVFHDGVALAQNTTNCNNPAGKWYTSPVSLQNPIETFAAAVNNSYLYVIGGFDCNNSSGVYDCDTGTYQTQVGYVGLNSVGSLNSNGFTWQNLWSLTQGGPPVGLSRYLCGVTYTGSMASYLYTVGGLVYDPSSGAASVSNEVWFAQIDSSNGSLMQWKQASNQLKTAVDLHGTVVLNGYLYVIGGTTDNTPGGLTDEVWSAKLNPNNGDVGSFSSQPPIESSTNGIYKTCPVAYDGYIFVAGGETNNGANKTCTDPPATSSVWYAKQVSGGTLDAWVQESGTSNNLPGSLASQAVAYDKGIILMGGDQSGCGDDTGQVWLGDITDVPSTIQWSTNTLPSLPSTTVNVIERNAGATYAGSTSSFIYSLGGEITNPTNGPKGSSDTAAIYCLEH